MRNVGRDLNSTILQGVPPDEVRVAEEVLRRMKDNLREQLGPQAVDIGDEP